MLTACAGNVYPTPSIQLGAAPDGHCFAKVGNTVIDPIDAKILAQQVALSIPDKTKDVKIEGTPNTPYRCIGGAIFTLQRLGYKRVGFASEPPESEPSK